MKKHCSMEKSKCWVALGLWPLFFFPLAESVSLMESTSWFRWVNNILGAFSDYVPHLGKLKVYAFNEMAFNLIMSLSFSTGVVLGISLSYLILPKIIKKNNEERYSFIKKNIWFLPGLVLFVLVTSWAILITGPMSVDDLTKFTRLVTQSTAGIAAYGVIYCLSLSAFFCSFVGLIVLLPMHIKYYVTRNK